jgi:hypothetical protein
MNSRNRYLEAFKENVNLIGLTTAFAASAATLNPLPLLVGLVAEVAYLMFYADSRWYAVRLAKKFDAEVEARRQALKDQVLPQLQPMMRGRFQRLEEVRRSIGTDANEEKDWFREILRKLDFLLEKWLQFASKDVQFRNYLESVLRDECGELPAPQPLFNTPSSAGTAIGRDWGKPSRQRDPAPGHNSLRSKKTSAQQDDPALGAVRAAGAVPLGAAHDPNEVWTQNAINRIQAHYDNDVNGIRVLIEHETDTATRAVLEKRMEVLNRRREFVGKIGRIQTNLNHQLNLLEDSFGLISDEIRARPPQQLLSDIEDVVSQTNTMTQLLEEVAPYEQLLAS